MRKNLILALVLGFAFSFMLASCATYHDPNGNVEVSDSICSSGACPLLIIAMMAGLAAAVAYH